MEDWRSVKRIKSILVTVVFFLLSICALKPVMLYADSGVDVDYIYAIVDQTKQTISLAEVVRIDDTYLVYSSNIGGEENTTLIRFNDKNDTYEIKPIYTFNNEIKIWSVNDPTGLQYYFNYNYPTKNEEISCYFPIVSENQMKLEEYKTIITDAEINPDEEKGAILKTTLSGDGMNWPAFLLNSNGECVGVFFNNTSYTAKFDNEIFEQGSDGGQTGSEGASTSVKSSTDLDDSDQDKQTSFLDTIKKGLPKYGIIGLLILVVVVLIIVILTKNKKGSSTGAVDSYGQGGGGGFTGPPENGKTDIFEVDNGYPITPISDEPVHKPQPSRKYYLQCQGGYMDGRTYEIKDFVTIGRNPSCSIKYPSDYAGVSRTHITIKARDGKLLLKDTSSTGTYIKRMGGIIPKDQWIEIKEGDSFYIGDKKNKFIVVKM